MRLLFRFDASSTIGTGHAMRCWALAEAARAQKIACHWASEWCPPEIHDQWKALGATHHPVHEIAGSARDATTCADLGRGLTADWIILDGHHFGESYQRTLVREGHRVCALDDYGHCQRYAAHIVINQNASADPRWYAETSSNSTLLLGLKYALLRKEFSQEPAPSRPQGFKRPARVLLTTGGADPGNASLILSRLLRQNFIQIPMEIKVILGSLHPNRQALASLSNELKTEGSPLTIELCPPSPPMCALMDWADIAISGAGNTLWELHARGVPTVLLTLVENQISNAHSIIERQKTALDGSSILAFSPERFLKSFKALLDSPALREQLSARSQALVDGQGPRRILKHLMNFQI